MEANCVSFSSTFCSVLPDWIITCGYVCLSTSGYVCGRVRDALSASSASCVCALLKLFTVLKNCTLLTSLRCCTVMTITSAHFNHKSVQKRFRSTIKLHLGKLRMPLLVSHSAQHHVVYFQTGSPLLVSYSHQRPVVCYQTAICNSTLTKSCTYQCYAPPPLIRARWR